MIEDNSIRKTCPSCKSKMGGKKGILPHSTCDSNSCQFIKYDSKGRLKIRLYDKEGDYTYWTCWYRVLVAKNLHRFQIHHRDGNCNNNSLENLEIIAPSLHKKIHKLVKVKE